MKGKALKQKRETLLFSHYVYMFDLPFLRKKRAL